MINSSFWRFFVFLLLLIGLTPTSTQAQIDEDQGGAWYMYFWTTNNQPGNWGLQGDVQYRNWNLLGDLEQLLLRGGVTYRPDSTNVKFTLGYAHITTGQFGPGTSTIMEHRIYQEALLPQAIGRFRLRHRFRYEQRFVDFQDFRTRYRYNLFLNVPLNNQEIKPGTVYLALYNELFINGQRGVGYGNSVELFDRNRAYTALGYHLLPGLKIQVGWMIQTTDNWEKGQMQLSAHHKF